MMLKTACEFVESKGFHLMTRGDIPKFVECSAEAYGSIYYPLNDYFVGHPCTKDELREMWLFNLRYFYSRAIIYSDSPDCNAWSLWVPPGCKGVSLKQFLMCGGLRLTCKLSIAALCRIMHYEDYSAVVRMNTTGGNEWYLYNLVVAPKSQGTSLASRLLEPMLEFCSSQKKSIYLETHLKKNVAMYSHFGFDVVSDSPLPGTEMIHWGMMKPALRLEKI